MARLIDGHLTQKLSSWKGCPPIPRDDIDGVLARIEHLDISKHGEELYNLSIGEAAALRVKYLWESVPKSREEYFDSLEKWMEKGNMYFVMISKANNCIEAAAAVQNIIPEHGRCELGPYFSFTNRPSMAKDEAAIRLMEPIFNAGYRRCEFKVWTMNLLSLIAAQRMGFLFEGVHRKSFVIKGQNRDDAWFSVTCDEWPFMKHLLDTYTAQENIDTNCNEIRSIPQVRRDLLKLSQYQEVATRYESAYEFFKRSEIVEKNKITRQMLE